MRTCILAGIFILAYLVNFAQKAAIDSSTLKNWTSVNNVQISKSGKYAFYTVENQPLNKQSLVVLDTKNSWRLVVPGCPSGGLFSSDSKYVIFINEHDSMGILKTGKNIVQYIPFVQSFAISHKGNAELLVYQTNSTQKTLRIHNLETGKEKSIDFVQQYMLSGDGSALLFTTEEKKSSVNQAVHWLNLFSGNLVTIWQGGKAGNFVFDKLTKQVAFTVDRQLDNQVEKTIWYYKDGASKAVELTNRSFSDDNKLKLDKINFFSEDGESLFVTLKRDMINVLPSPVDVWSYTDTILQSIQMKDLSPKLFKAVINIKNSHLIRLEMENERLTLPPFLDNRKDDWGIIINRSGNISEDFWNTRCSTSIFLISTKTGLRKRVPELDDFIVQSSPKGKYLIYYNPKQKSYFSYEIDSGIIRNITENLHVDWIGYVKDQPASIKNARGVAGWMKNDEAVLIYDDKDIWQIDPNGKKTAVNVTNGYGNKHNIVFTLSMSNYYNKIFSNNERLIINAFNLDNKENGYFSKVLSEKGDPELLTMNACLYDIPGNPYVPPVSFTPQKAEKAEVYLVQRMKANEAPNIYSTSDFKTFTPLSDIHPEKKYNWLTAELVTWKALDGSSLQGILYKPENFDPQKKYPVIFNYYERKSDGLHAFLKPDLLSGGGNINIPWYASNGYLIFVPDIHYKIGETGESAINSLVSAAQHLSKMPCINPKKMGIQGFSFGGYETNYIVTHTNVFAAACSASGLSNLVSAYGSLSESGASLQAIVEFTQVRIGATLWENRDIYIKNSPVFDADKVTTPLLIMHTKQDGICPLINATEFFTALRRLNKKVWMLQYEGNHFVDGKSAQDFSIRLAQFFDHYLRDAPPPKWMLHGVPAKFKGIETGLEITQK
jgi:dipeptidyl aminopeptidase/acylaminoacyl peptidase